MSGLDSRQLFNFVVIPALKRLEPWVPFSRSAAQMVLGTAMTESDLRYIDQVDSAGIPGPAYGLWQMEALTYADHFKRAAPGLRGALNTFLMGVPGASELHGNLYLGAAMCRVLYWHAPESLPLESDALSMAQLWKKRYNTPLGAGTVERALPYFVEACKS